MSDETKSDPRIINDAEEERIYQDAREAYRDASMPVSERLCGLMNSVDLYRADRQARRATPAPDAELREKAALALADNAIAQRDAPLYKTMTRAEREAKGLTAQRWDELLEAYRATLEK